MKQKEKRPEAKRLVRRLLQQSVSKDIEAPTRVVGMKLRRELTRLDMENKFKS